MIAARLFLGISALIWLPYGVYCFLQPQFLEQAAAISGHSPTALTELRAMYGGLEAGIGALCLCALFRRSLVQPALLMMGFICSGLALTRTAGLVLDASASAYTFGALTLEAPSALLAILLAARS